MIFNFSIILSPIVYGLLALSLVLTAGIVVWHFRRYRAVRKCAAACAEEDNEVTLSPATVVVYAHNDGAYLEKFLPYLMNQNYPEYEVIVVNDSSVDNSSEVISQMLTRYDNLRQTFIPEGSRNVSRRKLAIMLGVKAAKHELIVVTNANCCPAGQDWLLLMCRNFTPDTDVVIGYSRPKYKKDRKFGKNYRVYDNVTDSVQYLSSDVNGYPFRGTNDNLAYRRSAFFANNGFHRSLMLHYGDDDLFVSEIANAENTRVELNPDAMMTACYGNYKAVHAELKLRHDFTAKRLRRWPFVSSSLISAMQYANVAALAAAVALDCHNLFIIGAAVLIFVLLWTVLIALFRGNAGRLKAPKLHIGIPLYAYMRPLVNALYAVRGYRMRESNFTWQRLR